MYWMRLAAQCRQALVSLHDTMDSLDDLADRLSLAANTIAFILGSLSRAARGLEHQQADVRQRADDLPAEHAQEGATHPAGEAVGRHLRHVRRDARDDVVAQAVTPIGSSATGHA